LKLTITDTPGFGDQINNKDWYSFILNMDQLTVQFVHNSFLEVDKRFSYSNYQPVTD